MSNKVYGVFIGLFVLATALFFYTRWSNGGFTEPEISVLNSSSHKIKGFYLEGSFREEKDELRYQEVQRSLIEDYKLEEVSSFYYVNPTKENRETYKVFLGEEIKEGYKSALPDSLEIRAFSFKNVVMGKQKCSVAVNSIHDGVTKFLEARCESNSKDCLEMKTDSIFEQYSREKVRMEMLMVKVN